MYRPIPAPLSVTVDTIGPRVMDVKVSGSASTHAVYDFVGVVGSGQQLRTVPVGGLNRIEISFGEQVALPQTNPLTLTGLHNGSILA